MAQASRGPKHTYTQASSGRPVLSGTRTRSPYLRIVAGLASTLLLGAIAHAEQPAVVATVGNDVALATVTPARPAKILEPLETHANTSRNVVEKLQSKHFLKRRLDDKASSEIFDKYLEMLDPNRSYLLQSDIDEFAGYRFKLDDALKQGDLELGFAMFNRYQERIVERLEFALEYLNKGLRAESFNGNDQYQIDRSEDPWPASSAVLDDIWRSQIKANALAMRLSDEPKSYADIQETLTKRYKNRLNRAQLAKSEDAFQTYLNAFAHTFDPHTQYLSPRGSENFNINMSLSLTGIGAVLRTNEDDETEVLRLVPKGPADKSTLLKPHDKIIGVGQGNDGPVVDVVGWRLDDVVDMIRGPKESIVRLAIRPKSDPQSTKTIQITRNIVRLEEQSAQKKVLNVESGGLERKIGIITIPTFYADFKAQSEGVVDYKSTTRDVTKLISELKDDGVEAIIVDLRNNGGGSLQEANQLTGLFIKTGPTVQIKTLDRRINIFADNDNGLLAWSGPMAVIVNRLSASASEIFAGAIQDYQRGLVVGSQTFGKGTVQTLLPLLRGQLKVTQAKFYRVSGQSTQHRGVVPDIAFPDLYDPETIGESSLDDALPWDMIRPTVHQNYYDLDAVRDTLRSRHLERSADNPDFVYLNSLVERAEQRRNRNLVSLNEAQRIKEKAEDDAWRLTIENRRRVAKGEPPIASLSELEEDEDDETSEDSAAPAPHGAVDGAGSVTATDADPAEATDDSDAAEKEDDDALVDETANILLDFIKLDGQAVVTQSASTQRSNPGRAATIP